MNTLIGSYIEKNSLVHKLAAFIKLICVFILITAIIMCQSIYSYIVCILFLTIIIHISHIGFFNAMSGVKRMWLFFVMIFLMNCFFFESSYSLWSWWIFHLSYEGIIQGLNVVLRVVFSMIVGNLFVSTTSPLDIVGAIESFIFSLRYIGVPIQDVAMILGVSIQFIPMFIEETDMIKKAQIARGARFESKKLLDKAKSIIPLVIPVFLSAFKKADELSIAMEARGYHRTRKKERFHHRHIQMIDISILIIVIVFCIIEMII